jgi:hypothetical protein
VFYDPNQSSSLSLFKVAKAREQHEKEFAEAPKKEVYLSIVWQYVTGAESILG